MNNQEAKRIIEDYLALDSDIDNEFIQAQRVAISALERQKCENCKILELLVDFDLVVPCEDENKDYEWCENYCHFKAPTKECYLHWADMRKESE